MSTLGLLPQALPSTTFLSALKELLIAEGIAVEYVTDAAGFPPVLSLHTMPDDPDNILNLMAYDFGRDQLQHSASRHSRRFWDVQFKLRMRADEEAVANYLIEMWERLEDEALPYTALDGSLQIVTMHRKSGPFKLAVDRTDRVVYSMNIRVSFRRLATED